MASFDPPEHWLREVTADERYSGGELAGTTADQAASLLAPERRTRIWVRWHDPYEDPDSYLSRRVAVVRRRLGEALDAVEAGLDGLEVVDGDAADLSLVAHVAPAQVVLACGIYGNVVDSDVRPMAHSLPTLCAPGAWTLWTRHRQEPDLTPRIRSWYADAGFDEVAFDAPDDLPFGVGTARWPHATPPVNPDVHLFTFVA